MTTATSVLRDLPGLAAGIPAPPESLDPVLDAASTCFARHGVRRTSVQDIARELGVDRTTVYRQAGNVERIMRLLMARELHRLLEALPASLLELQGPAVIVDVLATVVAYGRNHPVLAKVLADEPEVIGPFLVTDAPVLLDQIGDLIAPVLQAAMDAGELAPRDPHAVAHLLVRLCLSLLLAPPPGDPAEVLAELLVPALAPPAEETP
ncbi:MAG TPA: TetR/AcrR family transcriptional regulator [Acidimicrobiales bacterium]|nr:TetR/AcrR family transcriptional regulator [Acidimicrobiales bacterium]